MVKSNVRKLLILMSFLCSLVILGYNKVSANELTFNAEPLGKNYKDLGYFKFNSEPGHDYNFQVSLSNGSQHPVTVTIKKLNGLTSIYGNTQYITQRSTSNSKLTDKRYYMTQYLEGPKEVKLEKGQTKNVTFYYHSPKNVDTGTVLGGLSFEDKNQEPKKSHKKGITINNTVSRIIGVEADYSKKDEKALDAIKNPKVSVTQQTPYLNMHMVNKSSEIINNITLRYIVSQNGKKVFENTTNDFKMAPKSEIFYQTNWNSKHFKSGKYHLSMVMKYNKNPDNQDMSKNDKENDYETVVRDFDFYVKDNDVSTYSKMQKDIRPTATSNINWLLILLLVLAVVIIVLMIVIIVKQRKNSKNNKE